MNGIPAWFNSHWKRFIIALCVVLLAFIVFCIWPTTLSLFFWSHVTGGSGALAAWVAAIAAIVTAVATVVLLRGLWLTKQSIEESRRTALFQLMHERFNAPDMRFSRATFARTYMGRYDKGGLDRIVKNNTPPRHGFQIIEFLNQVGHLVQTRRLDSEDVVLAYSSHVLLIGSKWQSQLDEYFREGRYRPFLDLFALVNTIDQPKAFKTGLEQSWLPAQRAFWESEAALDPAAKSEDDLPLPPDA